MKSVLPFHNENRSEDVIGIASCVEGSELIASFIIIFLEVSSTEEIWAVWDVAKASEVIVNHICTSETSLLFLS